MKISKLSATEQNVGIIQIGFGLIGTAIDQALSPYTEALASHQVKWQTINSTIKQLDSLFNNLKGLSHLEIIWSAGKAGFSADDNIVDLELNLFRQFLEGLNVSTQSFKTRFWMMSSAGGLHEGQTCVSSAEDISQLRPYSRLKYEQEKLVSELFPNHMICRISSVYTVNNLSGRLGLLPVLMLNGIQHKVSTLVGNESTLRDYVLDKDIASSISNQIKQRSDVKGIHYFINGSPTSIKTIKEKIESIILKKLYIKYASVKSNAANITFLKGLRSDIFHSTQ